VLQTAVDRFGWTLLVPGRSKWASTSAARLLRVRPSLAISTSGPGDAGAERLDQLDHQLAARGWVGVPVGGDHPLVWVIGQDVEGRRELLASVPRWPSKRWFSRDSSEGRAEYALDIPASLP
jgi:hypothetical protein